MQSAQARTAAASTSTSSVSGRILPYSFYLFSLFTSSLLIAPLPSLLNSSSLILSLAANLFPIDAPLHATTYRCVYFFIFFFVNAHTAGNRFKVTGKAVQALVHMQLAAQAAQV
jgi:hypothetical protein